MNDTALAKAVRALEPAKRRALAQVLAGAESIAVVGIGCRLPGGADDAETFWDLLVRGIDGVGEVPRDRWDVDALYDPDPDRAGKMSTRWGGFLEAPALFDREFFGITPHEAESMDPQQRVLLEVVWEAIEDAGITAASLAGTRCGVFVGICNRDYDGLRSRDLAAIDAYSGTGNHFNIAAGRISYWLDLRGPSMAIDTACSSSLVATHIARESLLRDECDAAIVAGVNLILAPDGMVCASRMQMMAPDGRSKAFDARADGFVRGEGCGVVVLRRLSDAVAGGDRIWAVIRGSAVNQDGRSAGLTAPSVASQEDVIRRALRAAHLPPDAIGYVEAHGTGTPLGDPIEVEALRGVFAGRAERPGPWFGSVKTNLGHLESAAGVAGLIKAALAVHHGSIPESLHFETLNPNIPTEGFAFRVPTQLESWPAIEGPRRAGVSSFGWSGTNAHVVLEAPPAAPSPESVAADGPWLIPASAATPAGARERARRVGEWLATREADVDLGAVGFTAGARRSPHASRIAVTASDAREAVARLQAAAGELPEGGVFTGQVEPTTRRRVVFLFPGQGCQWPGMGRELYERNEAFRSALDACDGALRAVGATASGRSLAERIRTAAEWERVDEIQPAIFALEVALAAWWRSIGVEPAAVVGHSMGEIAAAVVAGALSVEDGARVVWERSHSVATRAGPGGMAVVELSGEDAEKAIARYAGALCLAAHTGPRSSVVSGEPPALDDLVDALTRAEVFCRRVDVDYASHSPSMDPLLPGLRDALAGLEPGLSTIPFHSTVVAGEIDGASLGADYWARNLRAPVQLWPVLDTLLASRPSPLIVEVSPHPVLLGSLDAAFAEAGTSGISSLRREHPELETLLGQVGAAWCAGAQPRFEDLVPAASRRLVSLPGYPWQRDRYWLEAPEPRPRLSPADGSPLLGYHVESSSEPGTHLFEAEVGVETVPYLADHRVGGVPVLPAAAYVEMGVEAARRVFGVGQGALVDLTFERLLPIPEEGIRRIQLVVERGRTDRASFTVRSSVGPDGDDGAPWPVFARGTMLRAGEGDAPDAEPLHLEAVRARCTRAVSDEDHRRFVRESGLVLGPAFLGLGEILRGEGEALARWEVPATERRSGPSSVPHPVAIDAALQALTWTLPDSLLSSRHEGHFLPARIARTTVWRDAPTEGRVHVRLREQSARPEGEELRVDVALSDLEARPLLTLEGVELRRHSARSEADPRRRMFEVACRRRPLGERTPVATLTPGPWIVCADRSGIGARVWAGLRASGLDAVALDEPPDSADLDACLASLPAGPVRLVHLWSLDVSDAEPSSRLEAEITRATGSVAAWVRALAGSGRSEGASLWIVTRRAQPAPGDQQPIQPAQAPAWGLGKTVSLEHTELSCFRLDVDAADDVALAAIVLEELEAGDGEPEVLRRGADRFVHRLVRFADAPRESAEAPDEETARDAPYFRVEIDQPGILDRIVARARPLPDPEPGQVRIRVHAAGQNFKDVLLALGVVSPVAGEPLSLGFECAGVVDALGPGVDDLQVGDRVLGVAPHCLASHAVAVASLVRPIPRELSFTQAATLPIAYLTAWYALRWVGRVASGDRVLIHSASGGLGLAAIAVARSLGAEVYATAGSEEKRRFLTELGLDTVCDSGSLAFESEIRAATGGEGVDVVLNSLTGAAAAASLELLAPYGRFVEVGVRDIRAGGRLDLRPFERNLTYSAVDVGSLLRDRPELGGELLAEVVAAVELGTFDPLPCQAVAVSQVVDSFREMAQARHIGKRVVRLQDPELRLAPPAESMRLELAPDESHLVTGGLGGLGLEVARWLVERGARTLVLVGRSQPSDAAADRVRALRARGAEVHVWQADVSERDDVERVFDRIERELPPLRSVVHAAGVIDDGLLVSQQPERLWHTLAPKVLGSLHLHERSRELALDRFVLFSSAVTLLGSPGQATYTAANAYLDALAHLRRAEGLPAQSIDWGPWSEVGLASARPERGERLEARGGLGLSTADALEAFEEVLRAGPERVGVLDLDLARWIQFYPRAADSPFLEDLVAELDAPAEPRAKAVTGEIAALATGAERRDRLDARVRAELGAVLGRDISAFGGDQPLDEWGFDSLLAVELRNRFDRAFGVRLSATMVWNHRTIDALVTHLADKLGVSIEDEPPAGEPDEPTSAAEAAAALASELEAMA